MSKQPEALFFADVLDSDPRSPVLHVEAAAELRRLHALNGELLEALKLISATKNLARELEAEWCPAATGMVRMARTAIAARAKIEF